MTYRLRTIAVSSALMLLLIAPLGTAAEHGPVAVKKDDRCPVCGMFVAKYREWIAQIIFTDGGYAVFDGPKDMLKFWTNMAHFAPSRKQSDVAAVYVTEYYSTRLVDARTAFFIAGSDVLGPMGIEFVPVGSEAQAREFMKDHKGRKIMRFSEITAGDLK